MYSASFWCCCISSKSCWREGDRKGGSRRIVDRKGGMKLQSWEQKWEGRIEGGEEEEVGKERNREQKKESREEKEMEGWRQE